MNEYELAAELYTECCRSVGGKAFDGSPLPTAKDFFNDDSKKRQSEAWVNAAKKAICLITDQ